MICAPCFLNSMVQLSILENHDLLNFVTLLNLVNHFQAFHHFPEASVVTVEMGRVVATVANEKLRTAGVAACVCHRQYAAVVVLVVAVEFTFDGVTRSSCTVTVRTASLNHEIWYYSVES